MSELIRAATRRGALESALLLGTAGFALGWWFVVPAYLRMYADLGLNAQTIGLRIVLSPAWPAGWTVFNGCALLLRRVWPAGGVRVAWAAVGADLVGALFFALAVALQVWEAPALLIR